MRPRPDRCHVCGDRATRDAAARFVLRGRRWVAEHIECSDGPRPVVAILRDAFRAAGRRAARRDLDPDRIP